MKYDLVFGYFGWIGIDLDVCFDDLGFSVTICRFQILMLFVFQWICLFNLGKGWFSLCGDGIFENEWGHIGEAWYCRCGWGHMHSFLISTNHVFKLFSVRR